MIWIKNRKLNQLKSCRGLCHVMTFGEPGLPDQSEHSTINLLLSIQPLITLMWLKVQKASATNTTIASNQHRLKWNSSSKCKILSTASTFNNKIHTNYSCLKYYHHIAKFNHHHSESSFKVVNNSHHIIITWCLSNMQIQVWIYCHLKDNNQTHIIYIDK